MDLTSENVENVFMDCLFADGENNDNHIKAEGITSTVGFHPDRLLEHKVDVREMLENLPGEFQNDESGGGGWSFLNACQNKEGSQWTDLHLRMEQLFLLGIGLGIAKWLLPREMWSACPGEMPYVVVLKS